MNPVKHTRGVIPLYVFWVHEVFVTSCEEGDCHE